MNNTVIIIIEYYVVYIIVCAIFLYNGQHNRFVYTSITTNQHYVSITL